MTIKVNISDLSNEQLIDELAGATLAVKTAEDGAKVLRAELLKRQLATGEMSIFHNGWKTGLKRDSPSVAWFKRETGYEEDDIPKLCFTEKVSLVPDWEKVGDWLMEHHGHGLPVTHSLTFQRDRKVGQ